MCSNSDPQSMSYQCLMYVVRKLFKKAMKSDNHISESELIYEWKEDLPKHVKH